MSITSANAVIMLSIPNLFNAPQKLQGFAADDIFDTETISINETLMGVDGVLSAGTVLEAITQNYSLQGDSVSASIFDTWYLSMRQAVTVYYANAMILLPDLARQWTMTKGALTKYPPIPDAKKILQPRKFAIVWQSMVVAPYTA